jgi:hypothetical protein
MIIRAQFLNSYVWKATCGFKTSLYKFSLSFNFWVLHLFHSTSEEVSIPGLFRIIEEIFFLCYCRIENISTTNYRIYSKMVLVILKLWVKWHLMFMIIK